jgi:opacity protein-like surface antigen
MRNRLFIFVVIAILATPVFCPAAPSRPGPYMSGFVGVTVPTDSDVTAFGLNERIEFDQGITFGGTGGFNFGFLRLEGEISYKHGGIQRVNDRIAATTFHDVDGRIGVLAFMGNMFVDLHNPSAITPYFGGGLGSAILYQSDTFSGSTRLYQSDASAVFAYQAGAGVEVALTRSLSLDLGYRYFRTSTATFNKGTSLEDEMRFESHNVALGFRLVY